jgi:hypothetical protein
MTAVRVEPTKLLLSEAYGSDRTFERVEHDPVVAHFEDLLELHDRAVARGLTAQAEAYADRIVDEMTAGLAR